MMSEYSLENMMCHRDNLEAVLDNLKEGIIAHDMERRIFFFNTEAERITGYLVGGISPLGTKLNLRVVMEKSILKFEEILINAGQRGIMLKIAPEIIRTLLNCRVADVSQ